MKKINPISKFKKWFSEEKENNNMKLPAACCLSTLGLDGYPNSRFVSLKEISNESFVITGPLSSRKGKEIDNCLKAAIAFWWPSTERQIRIQGDVSKISSSEAEGYFKQRNRDSKIVSTVFNQGMEIRSAEDLIELFELRKEELQDHEIKCPKNWGGIYLKPVRIEFMEFKENRLHERKLYKKIKDEWKLIILQP